MRGRAGSRSAPARPLVPVLLVVFALAVCVLACSRAAPAASAHMRTAMAVQASGALVASPMTGTGPHACGASHSATLPGPGTQVLSVNGTGSDCACCTGASRCGAAILLDSAWSAGTARHAHPNAPPTRETGSSAPGSGVESGPRTASLTGPSVLRI